MTTMKELNWSRHICNERDDRMMEILMNDRLGEIINEDYSDERKVTFRATSTGCMLVCDGFFVITAYLMTFQQASKMYGGRVPHELYVQIQKNYKTSKYMYKRRTLK